MLGMALLLPYGSLFLAVEGCLEQSDTAVLDDCNREKPSLNDSGVKQAWTLICSLRHGHATA